MPGSTMPHSSIVGIPTGGAGSAPAICLTVSPASCPMSTPCLPRELLALVCSHSRFIAVLIRSHAEVCSFVHHFGFFAVAFCPIGVLVGLVSLRMSCPPPTL